MQEKKAHADKRSAANKGIVPVNKEKAKKERYARTMLKKILVFLSQ